MTRLFQLLRWLVFGVTRTMDSYRSVVDPNSTLVLSTESDFFKFLKTMGKPPRAPSSL